MSMKIVLFCGIALVFPVVLFLSLSDPPADLSLAKELAIVNANEQVSSNHPTIGEFRTLLDRLEKKCSNSRRDIADICMTGYLYRKDRGNLDTLLEFTRKVDEVIPNHVEVAIDLVPLVRAMMGE